MEPMTGGCLCGRCRFRLTRVTEVVDCHCSQCRRLSGAAYVTWVCATGPDLVWTAPPAFFASSDQAVRGFCPTCGSTLSMDYLDSDEVAVAVGAFDRPERFRPERSIHLDTAIPAAAGAAAWQPAGSD